MTERVIIDANGLPVQDPFGYFQYSIQLDAWVQNRIDNKGAAFYTAGDIRALKHRIHELGGELLGYKKIVADQDAHTQSARRRKNPSGLPQAARRWESYYGTASMET